MFRVYYNGLEENRLVNDVLNILQRVLMSESFREDFFLTFQSLPIVKEDTFHLVDFDRQDSFVSLKVCIPERETDITCGVLYAWIFLSLANLISESPSSVPPDLMRKIYGYATEYETREITKAQRESSEDVACNFFIAFGPKYEL